MSHNERCGRPLSRSRVHWFSTWPGVVATMCSRVCTARAKPLVSTPNRHHNRIEIFRASHGVKVRRSRRWPESRSRCSNRIPQAIPFADRRGRLGDSDRFCLAAPQPADGACLYHDDGRRNRLGFVRGDRARLPGSGVAGHLGTSCEPPAPSSRSWGCSRSCSATPAAVRGSTAPPLRADLCTGPGPDSGGAGPIPCTTSTGSRTGPD